MGMEDSRAEGSSPLARGLLVGLWGFPSLSRIIPARAGFTGPTARACGQRADHPRSRGVYGGVLMSNSFKGGSSPLARGLRGRPGQGAGQARIIPARAGFTRPPCPVSGSTEDHPRSRGVYSAKMPTCDCGRGSSPLARGLPRRWSRCRQSKGDHPRSRGVYPRRADGGGALFGSSPLARGLLVDAGEGIRHAGIIPARAGFTARRRCAASARRDHPRSRGVYIRPVASVPEPNGSSPLARGLLSRAASRRGPMRIIPARAGFTDNPGDFGLDFSDHPRSRGGYK